MGEKWTPLKPGFQHPISICVIIEVYWWCFGDELGSGWVMVAPLSCSLGKIGQNPRLGAHTGRQGHPFHPKLYQ